MEWQQMRVQFPKALKLYLPHDLMLGVYGACCVLGLAHEANLLMWTSIIPKKQQKSVMLTKKDLRPKMFSFHRECKDFKLRSKKWGRQGKGRDKKQVEASDCCYSSRGGMEDRVRWNRKMTEDVLATLPSFYTQLFSSCAFVASHSSQSLSCSHVSVGE